MKTPVKVIYSFLVVLLGTVLFSSFQKEKPEAVRISLPYKKAGLSERQAAAHLLSRFTYGARSGDIDIVVKEGLEKWFLEQLEGKLPDDSLNQLLTTYTDINLTNTEVENLYPRNAQVVRMAVKDGFIDKDSVNTGDKKKYRGQIQSYMQMKGIKPEQELSRQFISQKILRAAHTNNQLRELLTDFWFNHFNVSLTKNQSSLYIPAYERDVIRPNVTGKFENLLLATAKSPAMLIYLDNFTSIGHPEDADVADNGMMDMDMQMMGEAQQKRNTAIAAANAKNRNESNRNTNNSGQMNRSPSDMAAAAKKQQAKVAAYKKLQAAQNKKKSGGLNENYAREVMELHTLGVDGGYTQKDVTEAARVLTGWTMAPMGENGYGANIKKTLDKIGYANLKNRGFIREDDFLFAPSRHDNGEKVVLGKKFAAGRGYDEGLELMHMLAHHPAAAKFITKKLAIRFVSDNPPQSLLNKMAATFTKTDGSIRDVMITMVTAPEFWTKESLREKTKSPFEVAMSAVRGLDAEIKQPYQLFTWINKMGQKMYYYQAPTGYPDRGQYWINTGSLLNRMNFGLALASQKITGVKVNLRALNNNHEPESAEAALEIYGKLIMPERDLQSTIERLKPLLKDPDLLDKVQKAAEKTPSPTAMNTMMNEDTEMMGAKPKTVVPKKNKAQAAAENNMMLAQVVGVILGSPEFQRK